MAPINQISSDFHDYNSLLGSWGATIFIMAGMITSLLGIKIWWFKHRLNFEQTPAQNSNSRGSQPMHREKRQSQQVSDSVVVHGIFRKRNEDELDVFESPKQLPPIRVPLRSMSTTALIPPPRTKRNGNLTPEIPTSLLRPATPTAPNSSTFEENKVGQKFDEELRTTEASASINILQKESEAERLFQKVKPPPERKVFEKTSTARRATGILSTAEIQDLDMLLILSRENTQNGLQEQTAINLSEETSTTNLPQESKELKNSEERLVTRNESENSSVELFFKNLESIEDYSDNSFHTQNAMGTHEIYNLFETSHDPIYDINKTQQNSVINETHDLNRISQDEMYEKIDKLDKTFQNHTHEEFEKRRQSYQENEGHFLELNEERLSQERILSPVGFGKNIDEDWESFQDLKTTTFDEIEQITIMNSMTAETTSITELQDFNAHFNFNELESVTEHHSNFAHSNISFIESIEELYDELSDNDEEETSNNIVIMQSVNPPQKSSILKERLEAFANSGYEASTGRSHKLKAQQKVTFDVHTEEYYLPESDSDSFEEIVNNYSNNINECDFNDVDDDDDEHIEPTHDSRPPLPKSDMPVPMQRTTKTQYVVGDIQTDQNWIYNEAAEDQQLQQKQEQQHAVALLFDTKGSVDDIETNNAFDANNDSWTSTRQRHQNNEVDEKFTLTPIPHGSPRPAHQPTPRHPHNSTET